MDDEDQYLLPRCGVIRDTVRSLTVRTKQLSVMLNIVHTGAAFFAFLCSVMDREVHPRMDEEGLLERKDVLSLSAAAQTVLR